MKVEIEIPQFNEEKGISYNWENGFEIKVIQSSEGVEIHANKEGLISLANHMLNLAQSDIPLGCHMHFDAYNSLEDDSAELIIQKIRN